MPKKQKKSVSNSENKTPSTLKPVAKKNKERNSQKKRSTSNITRPTRVKLGTKQQKEDLLKSTEEQINKEGRQLSKKTAFKRADMDVELPAEEEKEEKKTRRNLKRTSNQHNDSYSSEEDSGSEKQPEYMSDEGEKEQDEKKDKKRKKVAKKYSSEEEESEHMYDEGEKEQEEKKDKNWKKSARKNLSDRSSEEDFSSEEESEHMYDEGEKEVKTELYDEAETELNDDEKEQDDYITWEKLTRAVKEDRARDLVSKINHAFESGELKGFKFKKGIHQAQLYAGTSELEVPPNPNMSEERLLVRHLATALLIQHPAMIEVQAAISREKREIYVASNSKDSSLAALLRRDQKLENFGIPDLSSVLTATDLRVLDLYSTTHDLSKLAKPYFDEDKPRIKKKWNISKIKQRIRKILRIQRHLSKLAVEIQGNFKKYKLVAVSGLSDQHAETKIIDEKGMQFDYIGGTRRPCTSCYIYMILKGISQETFNPHNGPLWNTIAAWLSSGVASLASGEGIGQIIIELINDKSNELEIFYKNKNSEGQAIYDHDTESEEQSLNTQE